MNRMSAMNEVSGIKVKCFNSNTVSDIENSMNAWLKNNDVCVVDIKFSSMLESPFNRYYTVLIIYSER